MNLNYSEWQRYYLRELYELGRVKSLGEEELLHGAYNINREELIDFLDDLVDRGIIYGIDEIVGLTPNGKDFIGENLEYFSRNDSKEYFSESFKKTKTEKSESKETKYWMVGTYWYSENPRERLPIFGKNKEWVNGHGSNSQFASIVNQVKSGDILICKSSYYSSRFKSSTLRLKGYGIVTKNRDDGTNLQVEWIVTNWKYDIPEFGFYRDTIMPVRGEDVNFFKEKLDETIQNSHPDTKKRRKHTLSTSSSDQNLIDRGYKNQGFIGYIKDSYFRGSRELFQRFLHNSDEFVYIFESESNEIWEGRAFTTSTIGYVKVFKNSGGSRLRRFYSEKYFDNIYCTNPDLETLEQEGYMEEATQGFESAFLFLYTNGKEGFSKLYVYSSDEDVRLFTPLDEIEATATKTSQLDYQTFLWSDSDTTEDELGRESLVKSVTESINNLFEKYKDAYTVLLNGEWGSGKSSMLNFFEKNLRKSGWEVIRYNAWENQQFSDPWWILINKISQYASKESLAGKFSSHRYWKFKLQYKHKVLALMLLGVFGVSAYYFSTSIGDESTDGTNYDIGFYTSLIGLVGTFIGAITGLINNFFFKSVSHEELKQQFTEHPFEPIRKRFNQIAIENNLAIFIDDLDRCNVDATVDLLEGIQNLFKDVRVLYIIAADGQWVSNCFTEKYKSFDKLTNDGTSIGDKFLQKTFQLTLNVPKPDPKDLELYWEHLIGQAKLPEVIVENDSFFKNTKPSDSERDETYREARNQSNQIRDEKIEEVKKKIEENIEHYLKKFIKLGVPQNPRQMKRFINQFEVTKITLVIEGRESSYQEEDQLNLLVRFLIFLMRYPSLADRLKKGEITKDDIITPDKDQKYTTDLTQKDRTDIEALLEGINEDLIKGDFYSI